MSRPNTGPEKQSRKVEQGDESRRRILEAASRLMASSGYAGTSLSAVSQESGLPGSSIYWHFGNKAGLLAAVLEEGATQWFERLPTFDDVGGSPDAQVAAMFDAAATELEARPEFLRLVMLVALERGDVDPEAAAAVQGIIQFGLDRLREAFLRLLDTPESDLTEQLADEFAEYTTVVAAGAFVLLYVHPERTDVRKVFDILKRSLYACARDALGSDV